MQLGHQAIIDAKIKQLNSRSKLYLNEDTPFLLILYNFSKLLMLLIK